MYNESEKQEFYRELDSSYFWLSAHYDCAYRLLQHYLPKFQGYGLAREIRILDAGCGSGKFVQWLKRGDAEIFGVDYSIEALQYCRSSLGIPVFKSNLECLAIAGASLDALVCIEAVEHVANDRAALKEYCRALKPGGIGLITVPAFQVLWGPHDDWFGHVRRYQKSDLSSKLREVGFDVVYLSYFKCFFFLPMLLLRKVKKWLGLYENVKTDYISIPRWLNTMLGWIIRFEVYSGISKAIPFGTHLVAVVRKPV